MAVVCANGEHRVDGKPYLIPDGARRVTIAPLTVEWGDQDLRDSWKGEYVFCSFGCLKEQAGEWSANHDTRQLVDGPRPAGDGT